MLSTAKSANVGFSQVVQLFAPGNSQLVTWSTRHTVKSCDELTVVSDDVVTSWLSFLSSIRHIQKLRHHQWLRYCTLAASKPSVLSTVSGRYLTGVQIKQELSSSW